ncbi:MAG: hypothetical protein JRF33_09350 [Deltaproteobacteria bacterium]|nr:hypothetical protein [Deltaproteobacteria bacterium]
MDFLSRILLIALPATPALGALVCAFLPAKYPRLMRVLGWTFALAVLGIWLGLRAVLTGGDGLLVSWHAHWVEPLGIGLHLALDNTGFLLAGMVAFLGVAAVVGTSSAEPGSGRSHIVSLLCIEAGMLGVVSSWDLVLFIAFWEVTLVPFFFIMGRGNTRGGVASATRFVISSVSSSVLMWVGVLWLVQLAGSPWTFDLVTLSERLAGQALPTGVIWLLGLSFLMRMAVFGLHTWLPEVSGNVPTAANIMLTGGVLPLGAFGWVHVVNRLFGGDLNGLEPVFIIIGLATAVAGGLASAVQRDFKRLLAYACMAQVGLAFVGLSSPDPLVRQGGLVLLVAAGLAGAGLSLFAGVICQARGSQRITDLSGLWRSHPAFAGLAFGAVASMAAMPGTLGFVGSFRILNSMVAESWALFIAGSAWLILGASVVWAYRRVLGGSYQAEVWTTTAWPRKREVGILALLAVALVVAGLLPGLLTPAAAAGGL